MAFYLYLDDHGEQFPEGGGGGVSGDPDREWENYLSPAYIDDSNIFICRSPEKGKDPFTGKEAVCNENYYGYNAYLYVHSKTLSAVSSPSTTILCADGVTSFDITIALLTTAFSISSRHSNGANILFVSGNACWFPSEVIDDNTDRGRVGSLPY